MVFSSTFSELGEKAQELISKEWLSMQHFAARSVFA